jgi:hypothetical protein
MSHASIGTVWIASFLGEIVIHDLYPNIPHHLFVPGLVWVIDNDPFEIGELLVIVLSGCVRR